MSENKIKDLKSYTELLPSFYGLNTRPINLIFMINVSLMTGGGMERTLLNFIKYIPKELKNIYKITIIQTSLGDRARLDSNEIHKILNENNVQLITIDAYNKNIINLRIDSLSTIYNTLTEGIRNRRLKKYINQITKNADIIYLFHNSFSHFIKKGPIVIGSFHERNPNPNAYFGFTKIATEFTIKLIKLRLMWRRINFYHYQAYNLKSYVPDNSFYIPNGIDLNRFTSNENEIENKKRDKAIKILFVGRLVKSKGLEILIDAFQIIRQNEGYELHIVGSGEMESYIQDLKVNKIIYHGILNDADLISIYKKCDIFVFPSDGDIFGLVILEALASGMYVIANETLRGVFDEFEKIGVLEYSEHTVDDILNRIMKFDKNKQVKNVYKKVLSAIKKYDWNEVDKELYKTFLLLRNMYTPHTETI